MGGSFAPTNKGLVYFFTDMTSKKFNHMTNFHKQPICVMIVKMDKLFIKRHFKRISLISRNFLALGRCTNVVVKEP